MIRRCFVPRDQGFAKARHLWRQNRLRYKLPKT